MKVGIVTIAHSLPKLLQKLFDTATSKEHEVVFYLFGHTKDKEMRDLCFEIEGKLNPRVTFFDFQRNRGASVSWNDGLISASFAGCDVTILANSDIWFTDGDIDKFAEFAVAHREAYMISCAGWHDGFDEAFPSQGHSCFILNPIALEKVGFFDENLFPAYMEDCDYSRRASLVEMHELNCADTMVHHYGSACIQHDIELSKQNAMTHQRNHMYYRHKWGGSNGKEQYVLPFNDPEFSHMITVDDRHAPYPGYNRLDQHIVKI